MTRHLKTTTSTIKAVFVTREDIIALLTAEGFKIPNDADVSIRVPGGGDWSNMDLDVDDEDQVICVRWKETE